MCKVITDAEMPRISSRQQHPSNAVAQTPKENFAIPLFDHIIMSINEKFSPSATVATPLLQLLGLVPSQCSLRERC